MGLNYMSLGLLFRYVRDQTTEKYLKKDFQSLLREEDFQIYLTAKNDLVVKTHRNINFNDDIDFKSSLKIPQELYLLKKKEYVPLLDSLERTAEKLVFSNDEHLYLRELDVLLSRWRKLDIPRKKEILSDYIKKKKESEKGFVKYKRLENRLGFG